MRPKSKWLRIGSVRVFDEVEPSKAQALKVGEEAAEVYGAWQLTHLPEDKRRLRMNFVIVGGYARRIREALGAKS